MFFKTQWYYTFNSIIVYSINIFLYAPWNQKNSCDLLYCCGLELKLQHLRYVCCLCNSLKPQRLISRRCCMSTVDKTQSLDFHLQVIHSHSAHILMAFYFYFTWSHLPYMAGKFSPTACSWKDKAGIFVDSLSDHQGHLDCLQLPDSPNNGVINILVYVPYRPMATVLDIHPGVGLLGSRAHISFPSGVPADSLDGCCSLSYKQVPKCVCPHIPLMWWK